MGTPSTATTPGESESRHRTACGQVCYAVVLLLAINWVVLSFFYGSNAGRLFGADDDYQLQVAAFLDGKLAIANTPAAVRYDNVWFHGQVHQVWGLGVPMWMTPFEIAGRLVSVSPFPDRIALWIALLAFVIYTASLVKDCDRQTLLPRLGACLAILVSPPLWILVSLGPQRPYEDASVYALLGSLSLIVAILRMVWHRRIADLWVTAVLAAWLASVRPTHLCYAGAAIAIGAVLFGWRTRLKDRLHVLADTALSASGVAWLLVSNRLRFGSILEFGHHMTSSAPDNILTTRFVNPIAAEPFFRASLELLGATFFSLGDIRRKDSFGPHVFPLQTDVFRWRCWDFSTYDPLILILIFVGLAAGFRLLVQTKADRALRTDANTQASMCLLANFSICFAALFLFMVRYPGLWSRYLYDFWPAICSILIVAWLTLAKRNLLIGGVVFLLTFCVEGYRADCRIGSSILQQTRSVSSNALETAGYYDHGHFPTSINQDNLLTGWSPADNTASYAAMLPIDHPQFLELIVGPRLPVEGMPARPDVYRARLGGQLLLPTSVTPVPDSTFQRVLFDLPEPLRAGSSDELLFLCFVETGDPADRASRRVLRSVRWR